MRNISVIFILLFTLSSSAQQLGSVPSFFRVQRELPLLELNTTTTINVSDYGAIVNDGLDDVTAIRNAINAVKNIATAQNPVRLLFESGTYDIMYAGTSSHIIRPPLRGHGGAQQPAAAGPIDLRRPRTEPRARSAQ